MSQSSFLAPKRLSMIAFAACRRVGTIISRSRSHFRTAGADAGAHPPFLAFAGTHRLSVGDLSWICFQREVRRGGEKIELQPREFALLEYMMRHPNRPVTKTMILEHILTTVSTRKPT